MTFLLFAEQGGQGEAKPQHDKNCSTKRVAASLTKCFTEEVRSQNLVAKRFCGIAF